jgi:hypothetical protein
MENEQKLDTIMELLNNVAAATEEHLDNGPVHPPFSELGYFGTFRFYVPFCFSLFVEDTPAY